ncbi:hypothetical protein D3C80_1601350 [compost metagenome]
MVSTNSAQSISLSCRSPAILLLTESWLTASCWLKRCISSSEVRLTSARRCSTQVSGSASMVPCPCRRRTSSATKALVRGGLERAISAITMIRLAGSFSADSSILVTQLSARLRSSCAWATSTATRRRFSMSASLNMPGSAQSSPRVRLASFW